MNANLVIIADVMEGLTLPEQEQVPFDSDKQEKKRENATICFTCYYTRVKENSDKLSSLHPKQLSREMFALFLPWLYNASGNGEIYFSQVPSPWHQCSPIKLTLSHTHVKLFLRNHHRSHIRNCVCNYVYVRMQLSWNVSTRVGSTRRQTL